MFQDLQNTIVQFSNEGLPHQQTGVYTKIPSPTLPENQEQTHIQRNNNNTSTLNANKLNLDECHNQQHIEMPSI